MHSEKDCIVLIPAYNEQENIGPLVRYVSNLHYTVWVVDDGSTDETSKIAAEQGGFVLRTAMNSGKGGAMRRGFEEFLKSPYEVLIIMDADGQHDPADLEKFLSALNAGGRFVIGNRMHHPKGMSRLRVVTNSVMSKFLSYLSKSKVPDSQCGYRAILKKDLARMKLSSSRYEIESEMILEAKRAGIPISSIPIRCIYRGAVSNIHPVKDTGRFMKFLFRYYSRRPK